MVRCDVRNISDPQDSKWYVGNSKGKPQKNKFSGGWKGGIYFLLHVSYAIKLNAMIVLFIIFQPGNFPNNMKQRIQNFFFIFSLDSLRITALGKPHSGYKFPKKHLYL